MFEERANIAGVDYLFSGMELDTESGFSYCHKRYYHSKMGSFLSEDLLSHLYPNVSTLAYCLNNPIRYIDPTGMTVEIPDEQSQKHTMNYMKDQFGDRADKLFSFKRDGTMKLSNRQYNKFMNDKNVSAEQKELLSGMKEAINRPERLQVSISNENSHTFSITDSKGILELPLHLNNVTSAATGQFNELGVPIDGEYFMGMNNYASENKEYNGARTIGKDDSYNYRTGKSASSVFIHEVLDEFKNFFTTGRTNINSSPIQKTEYQNKALNNKGKGGRNDHHH